MRYMTIANKETLDSREVAKMIEKDHAHLCRDIKGYIDVISTNPKMDSLDYFIESTYMDKKGERRRCYDITKLGCEMIANKLTGKKGILFTAEYVKRFNDMEKGQAPLMLDPSKQMRAEAMLNNSQARKAKLLYQIATSTTNELYRQAGEALAVNLLAGKDVMPLPEAEQRPNHELSYFCKFIGKPESWNTVLGKKLKQAGIEKNAETGVFKVTWDKKNNQRDSFYWFDDVLLPKLAELFPNEYTEVG